MLCCFFSLAGPEMLCVFSHWSSLQDQTNLDLEFIFSSEEDALRWYRTCFSGLCLIQSKRTKCMHVGPFLLLPLTFFATSSKELSMCIL
jgi:hypothetical protein